MNVKKLFGLGLFALTAMIMTGCTSINTSQGACGYSASMWGVSYDPVVKHESKRVSGTATMHAVLSIFQWGECNFADQTNLNGTDTGSKSSLGGFLPAIPNPFSWFPDPVKKVKEAAVYKACQANNCDNLIGTKYEISIKDYVVYKVLTCKVTGFPSVLVDVKEHKREPVLEQIRNLQKLGVLPKN